jgi:transcription termination/antitermination protein NusG
MGIITTPWQNANPLPAVGSERENWYALLTKPRHEKLVSERLTERGVETFLPLVTEVHRWSDRNKVVQLPLFSCYVFARFVANRADCLRVLRVNGVLQLLGSRGEGTPIPNEQIDAVRTLVESPIPWSAYPFLQIGQRVRIRGGALDGVQGILLSRAGNSTLVISVDLIQRSLAVRVEGYQVEAV